MGRVDRAITVFRSLVSQWKVQVSDARQVALFPHVTFAGHAIVRGSDRIQIGDRTFIDYGAYLNPSTVNDRRGFIHIGNDVEIGPYSVLWGGGGLTIGNNVHLGAHVHITTQQGRRIDVLASIREPFIVDVAPVVIEDDALIYSGAIITPGVRIGRGAAVAAGAVVLEDVAPGELVGGIPARALTRSLR